MPFSPSKHTTILVLALVGLAMSGYLSYWALWGPSCHAGPIPWLNCGSTVVKIFNLPTCVYGFFMYFAVIVMTLIAWERRIFEGWHRGLIIVSTIGVLFSAGLSIYEIGFLKVDRLPACVYGFFLYAGILAVLIAGSRPAKSAPPSNVNAPPPTLPPSPPSA